MIPAVDMARVLAANGAIVTLITTPVNAARIKTIIDRVEQSGMPVRYVSLRFPAVEAGLPEGIENVDMLPSRDLAKNLLDAACLLRDPLVLHLRAGTPPPTCIISDNLHYWTSDVAREFGVPRLVFHGYGCFPLLCMHNTRAYKIDEQIHDGNEPFLIPGLPTQVEITRAKMPGYDSMPGAEKHMKAIRETESRSDGVVVNSFDAMEAVYCELYANATKKTVWTIGPLSLYNKDAIDIATRGNEASIDTDRCLMWLDSMKQNSVVYVSFGSMARTTPSQLVEIGLGLEASNCPFIWVIKAGDKMSEVDKWLSEFEERTREKGLVIRGWAPQVMILSHPAVGGFMTHCGWNSTLESVSAGVPMITWPHFGDQFLNEKLIVEVLRIGVPVGVKAPTTWGVDATDALVKKDDVENAVRNLFDEGKEGDEKRKSAKELGEKAREAVGEGGSSYLNVIQLIKHMK